MARKNLPFIFWITKTFDTWLAMYIERAADDGSVFIVSGWMTIFHFFSFDIFVTIHFTDVNFGTFPTG